MEFEYFDPELTIEELLDSSAGSSFDSSFDSAFDSPLGASIPEPSHVRPVEEKSMVFEPKHYKIDTPKTILERVWQASRCEPSAVVRRDRKSKNALSAEKSRKRKRQYIFALETELAKAKSAVEQLQVENLVLRHLAHPNFVKEFLTI